MKIFYIWADDGKIIDSVSLALGSNEIFAYQNNRLSIKPNMQFSNLFYTEYEKIESLHGVIGKNGAGKSTFLKLLSEIVECREIKSKYLLVLEHESQNYLVTNINNFNIDNIDYNETDFRINRILNHEESFFDNKEVSVIYYTSIIDYMVSISGAKTIDLSTNSYLNNIKMNELTFYQFESDWDSEVIEYLFSENNDKEFLPIKAIKVSFANDFYMQEVNQIIGTAFESLLSGNLSMTEENDLTVNEQIEAAIKVVYKTQVIKMVREYVQVVCNSSTEYIDRNFVAQYATDFESAYTSYINGFTDTRSLELDSESEVTGDDDYGNVLQLESIRGLIDEYEESGEELEPSDKEDIIEIVQAIADKIEIFLEEQEDKVEYEGLGFKVDDSNQEYLDNIYELQRKIINSIEYEDTEMILSLLFDFLKLVPEGFELNENEDNEQSETSDEIDEEFSIEEMRNFKELIIELDSAIMNLVTNPNVVDTELGVLEFDLRDRYEDLKAFFDSIKKVMDCFDDTHVSKMMVSYELPKLSTGERYHYELMSRIMKSQNDIKDNDVIILIDEGEVFLHPDAQRQFVEKLLEHLNKLDTKSINVVIASNSPFIVSDLTRDRLTLLGAGGNEMERTFGANIHEVLASEFFMDRTVGSLAYRRIIDISDDIKQGLSDDKIQKYKYAVNSIGEDFVRIKLMEKLLKLEPDKQSLIETIMNVDDNTVLNRIKEMLVNE